VSVLVGDKQATILETYENLIVAVAPLRYDFVTDTTVNVYVSNKNGRDLLQAEQKLSFVYYTNPSENNVGSTTQNGHVHTLPQTTSSLLSQQTPNTTLPLSIPVTFTNTT
jgi:hypothetical protein